VEAELYSGLVGALIGALVGGLATFLAQKTQTTRLIQAGTEQYRQAAQEERARAREAAEDERRAARQELGRAAALDLLQVLADVDKALPDLRNAGTPRFRGALRTPEWMELSAHRAEFALDQLRRALLVQVPVAADPVVAGRCDRLLALAREYATMELRERPLSDREGNVIEVADARVGRSAQDLEQYLRYVHATVRAWLDDRPMPPDLDPPVLLRDEVDVWRWDDS
jgi:gas vesicle protein